MSNRLESLIRSVALLLMAFSCTLYFGSRANFNDSSLLEFIAVMCLSGVFSFGVCYAPGLLMLFFAKDQMADVPDAGWPDFFCIETSNAGPDVIVLAPGAEHRLGKFLALFFRLALTGYITLDLTENKMLIKQISITLLVFLSGCQAIVYGTAADFEKISLGMTKTQVIQTIGSPVSVSADGDKGEEYLIYKRMKHAISEWPRTYSVTIRNGKVVKYGEQYEEKNTNIY